MPRIESGQNQSGQTAGEILRKNLRSERDRRLAGTDYLLMPDYPIGEENRAQVAAYRQALRDLPAIDGSPWDGGGPQTPWPQAPAIIAI